MSSLPHDANNLGSNLTYSGLLVQIAEGNSFRKTNLAKGRTVLKALSYLFPSNIHSSNRDRLLYRIESSMNIASIPLNKPSKRGPEKLAGKIEIQNSVLSRTSSD